MVNGYDAEAEATGWHGPEVAFGLVFAFVEAGQSILDIGIGTALGSVLFRKAGLEVHGMDNSPEMLDACRQKGFASLERHDLTQTPYPYESVSMDHVVCVGVLNFFRDLSAVFQEAGRILRPGGRFVFVVGDCAEGEPHEIEVGAEHTKSGRTVTMYRHDGRQIAEWMVAGGLEPERSLPFTVYMDSARTNALPAKAYVARKNPDD